jgi:hypothetical protein
MIVEENIRNGAGFYVSYVMVSFYRYIHFRVRERETSLTAAETAT